MNGQAITVEGTLQPDGTLRLDQKLALSPGRVQVVVRPLSQPTSAQCGLVELMDEIRAGQLARGYHGRTPAEARAQDAADQEENDGYERRCQDLWGNSLPPT